MPAKIRNVGGISELSYSIAQNQNALRLPYVNKLIEVNGVDSIILFENGAMHLNIINRLSNYV